MFLPSITGVIDRRILLNFRADPKVVKRLLPYPFRPKIVDGYAMVGICLIRLRYIRPDIIPYDVGLSSENCAHRIAVSWEDHDGTHEGVYIPRRDTSSLLNTLAGGRLFPGIHHNSAFNVSERGGKYNIEIEAKDGLSIHLSAAETEQWPVDSVFGSLQTASDFYRGGSVGYSPGRSADTYDGIELQTENWSVSPLAVSHLASSFFNDVDAFPKGSILFDNALLMTNIRHRWSKVATIRSTSSQLVPG